jgi:hypothetical protein
MVGHRTQDLRTDIGMKTTDTFLLFVVAKLKWNRSDIERDLEKELMARLDNAKLATDLRQRIVQQFDKHYNLTKFAKDMKDGYDAVKGFELSPTTIAKIAYGSMSKLAKMAFDAADAGMDRNRYYFPSDEFFDYLVYTSATAGRVQPRTTGLI